MLLEKYTKSPSINFSFIYMLLELNSNSSSINFFFIVWSRNEVEGEKMMNLKEKMVEGESWKFNLMSVTDNVF